MATKECRCFNARYPHSVIQTPKEISLGKLEVRITILGYRAQSIKQTLNLSRLK